MARTIADDLQLGERAVGHHFRDFRGTFSAFDEVAAGTAGIQARRVGRGKLDQARAFFRYCSTVTPSNCCTCASRNKRSDAFCSVV